MRPIKNKQHLRNTAVLLLGLALWLGAVALHEGKRHQNKIPKNCPETLEPICQR